MKFTLLALVGLLAAGNGQMHNTKQPTKITDLNCAEILTEQNRIQRCDAIEEQLINLYSKETTSNFKADKESREKYHDFFDTLNCAAIPAQYQQHHRCGTIYDTDFKKEYDIKSEIYWAFCPEKIQREFNLRSCKFMTKYPHGIDALKKCLEPNENFIGGYCMSKAEDADQRYWLHENVKSQSNKKNL